MPSRGAWRADFGVLVCLLAVATSAGAQAPEPTPADVARYEALATRAKSRLEALNKEAETLAARERTLLGELRQLEVTRQMREAELARAEAEYAAARADLERTGTRIAELQRRLEADRPAIEARLVRLYKQGPPDARWWLGVERVRDLARAYRTLSALSAADRNRLAAYQSGLQELSAARARLDQRTRQAADWTSRAQAAREAAARSAAAQATRVTSIDRQRDLTARLAGELQQAQERLQASITAMQEGLGSGAPEVLPLRPFQGTLEWPVRGSVTGRFGREQRAFGTSIVRNGVQVASAEGTPVKAIHEGRVAFADVFSGFGRLVIVEHGRGAFSLYGYLDAMNVSRGVQVDAGTTVGTTGRAPGGTPSLYFELRIDGRPVDPLQWLKPR